MTVYFKRDVVCVRSCPADPANNDLIVPEFDYYDGSDRDVPPDSLEGSTRFVELYNAGSFPVDLAKNWSLVLFKNSTTCNGSRCSFLFSPFPPPPPLTLFLDIYSFCLGFFLSDNRKPENPVGLLGVIPPNSSFIIAAGNISFQAAFPGLAPNVSIGPGGPADSNG